MNLKTNRVRQMRRPEAMNLKNIRGHRIHFEFSETSLPAGRCWNKPFWYGNGEPATEPAIILRESEYRQLRKLAALTPSPPQEPTGAKTKED